VKLAGTRLGPYEIHSSIGAGGMGEVYRARDTRLDRVVALKVIAGAVAVDPTFRERFDREARAISALDHPHICTLYDVGHENGVDFLVMQYLEGESLADRLARGSRPQSGDSSSASQTAPGSTVSKGPIPIDLALRYGAELASALDAAHTRGIVHRDLKPGNIILTKSGSKLLDFGLAKLAEQPGIVGINELATHTVPLTGTGSIVGTLNYMSPEQLEGGTVDARTDIFAFGAVLFEMLSGHRAFNAQSHAGLIAAILNEEAPALGEIADVRSPLPPSLHRLLDRLLRKCLAKEPDDRWQCAADLAAELRWIDEERLRMSGHAEPEIAAGPVLGAGSRTSERVWMSVAAAAVLALGALGAWTLLRPAEPRPTAAFWIVPPDGEAFPNGPGLMSVSPDGKHVAVVISNPPSAYLAIRDIGSTQFRRLAGTEGAWQPFWSPDSRSIAFSDNATGPGKLKRIDLEGGAVLTLASGIRGRGTWGSSNIILFDAGSDGLQQVAPNGGTTSVVARSNAEAGEIAYQWPLFLPDGRRYLYLAGTTDPSKSVIYLASLGSTSRSQIVSVNSSFEISEGHLLYCREGALYAHPFDMRAGQLSGEPRLLLQGVRYNSSNGRAAVSAASKADVLLYRGGGVTIGGQNKLTWFDRTGKALGTLTDGESRVESPAISPDGRYIAIGRDDNQGRGDIYVIEVERNLLTRLTSDAAADDFAPLWSPDGGSVYFASTRSGGTDIYRRAAGGAGKDILVFSSPDQKQPLSISPDGKLLLFLNRPGRTLGRDVWALPLDGTSKPYPILSTEFNEDSAAFSPDGRWIAYTSDDLGNRQVYVQPFPANGTRVRISPSSGVLPQWGRDGRTLYYITAGPKVISTAISTDGGAIRPGVTRELFSAESAALNARMLAYDPGRDWFLIPTRVGADDKAEPLSVILNWPSMFPASPATGR
jgi:eukaryotic-like serine/threonine-protein kinase